MINIDISNAHTTVLKKEAVDMLVINPDGIYIDATCGMGGHTLEILSRYKKVQVIACDWHLDALKLAKERLQDFQDRVHFHCASFSHLDRILKKMKILKVDGILADFGLSSYQIEHAEGFSFQKDTFLDMRMSKTYHKETAYDIVNFATEEQLRDIFFTFGEEPLSKFIAREIVERRKKGRIKTTTELVDIIKSVYKFKKKFSVINPATKVFQALRIALNKELDQICNLLEVQAPKIIKKEGRLVCISFHSLEDRLVKHAFKNKNIFKAIDGLIIPTEEEITVNPRSRSAKMRVAEII